jgi:hypothetical protein
MCEGTMSDTLYLFSLSGVEDAITLHTVYGDGYIIGSAYHGKQFVEQ